MAAHNGVREVRGQTQRFERIRLSEWARREGISIDTAYRMIKRGVMPAATERSPTGRWYVLMPLPRSGKVAFYVRASPGREAAVELNRQLATLVEWARPRRLDPDLIVREVADPLIAPLRNLGSLLADRDVGTIIIERMHVFGPAVFAALGAVLGSQGRSIVLTSTARPSRKTLCAELDRAKHDIESESA